ncbi:MAG: 50S ribosomal protein L11 methyltransferase [Campylobacteraceae bacterium]|nr:50S ribosomal protein L11 methyltransferase [Campylobacteraceae bacterium]
MVEHYYELQIKPQTEYALFLDLISALTAEAIEESSGCITLRSEENLEEIECGIIEFAKQLNVTCETKHSKLKNEDWVNKYKEAVKAVEVGKFYIHPTWVQSKKDKLNIIIDPALSFGSGHHETTSNCLLAMGKYVTKGNSLLDVGTGSGILAIGASKLDAIVDICDTDDFAVSDACENFKRNDAKLNKSWVGSATKSHNKYDIVAANIVADVLIMIEKDLKKCLKQDGILILSGILDKHMDRVSKKYNSLEQLEVIQKNEWVTLVFRNKQELI